jgi:hypothetical protein
MAQDQAAPRAPYGGDIAVGMVFDFEPGKKHRYERITITRKEGSRIWAYGRSAETFHDEAEFRRSVVFVSDKPPTKPRPKPLPLEKRYDGPIALGMVFDFEPAKKHQYERLIVTKLQGSHIWARGRSGETYHQEPEFRDHVVPVPPEAR